MGGVTSKNTVEILNQVINKKETQLLQECTNNVSAKNLLELKADLDIEIAGDLTQENIAIADTTCIMNSMQSADFKAKLSAEADQAIKQSDDRIVKLSARDQTEISNKTKNVVENYVKEVVKQISEASVVASNEVKLSSGRSIKIGGKIAQKNKVESTFKNVAATVSKMQSVADLDATVKTKTETEFTAGAGKFKAIALVLVALALVAAMVAIIVYLVKKPPSMPAQTPPMAMNASHISHFASSWRRA